MCIKSLYKIWALWPLHYVLFILYFPDPMSITSSTATPLFFFMSILPVLSHFNLYVKHIISLLNSSKNRIVILIGIALNMKILTLFQLLLVSSSTI